MSLLWRQAGCPPKSAGWTVYGVGCPSSSVYGTRLAGAIPQNPGPCCLHPVLLPRLTLFSDARATVLTTLQDLPQYPSHRGSMCTCTDLAEGGGGCGSADTFLFVAFGLFTASSFVCFLLNTSLATSECLWTLKTIFFIFPRCFFCRCSK